MQHSWIRKLIKQENSQYYFPQASKYGRDWCQQTVLAVMA